LNLPANSVFLCAMFAHTEILPFFPTLIWSHQIEAAAAARMNGGIRAKLEALIAASPDKDHTGMWQTEHDLHTLPELQELTSYFMGATQGVLEFLETESQEVEITGCWANISPSGTSHRSHMHANNFLSAVYYVSVPPGGDKITFHDPRAQIHVVAPAVKKLNGYNCEYVNVEVQEGMLILFPAWLVHSVPGNEGDALRMSVSFNINFANFTDRISPPIWQPNLRTHP
jgi:uncharacterized protein (TIGR02466 family)